MSNCIETSKLKSLVKTFMQIGSVLIFFGSIFYIVSYTVMMTQVNRKSIIKKNSFAFDLWKKPPATVYRKYFIFDVKNSKELLAGTEKKPMVIEKGPYVYKEVWEKKNVEFKNDRMVKYSPIITLYFEPSLSVGNESELVTFVNVPLLGMIEAAYKNKYRDLSILAANGIIDLFKASLFKTKTVGELISGYKDPLLTFAKTFVPHIVKDDKFGLLRDKNGTTWQNYTMDTGAHNINDIGKLYSWNGKTELDFWGTQNANMIKGTDGTIFPPFLKRKNSLFAFNPSMCRSYDLIYKKDEVAKGINTYKFHLPKNIFWNSTLNPANEGFCDGPCLGNGVQNISQCYGGLSAFISQPHFLNADENFINGIDGMNPDNEKHDLTLNFEPTTGAAIIGSIKFQINFFYTNYKNVKILKNLSTTLIPMFWFESKITIDKEMLNKLKKVNMTENFSNKIPLLVIFLGIISVLVSLAILLTVYIKESKIPLFFGEPSNEEEPFASNEQNYAGVGEIERTDIIE